MEKLNLSGLHELFGRALMAKLTNERSFRLGKHYRTRGAGGAKHPAGTKLMKKWFGKERIREALARRAALVKEIIAVENAEPGTGRMAHGVMKRNNKGALLRINRHGDVVAQFDDLSNPRLAYGWHLIPLLDDFVLDKPSLIETITRRVIG